MADPVRIIDLDEEARPSNLPGLTNGVQVVGICISNNLLMSGVFVTLYQCSRLLCVMFNEILPCFSGNGEFGAVPRA